MAVLAGVGQRRAWQGSPRWHDRFYLSPRGTGGDRSKREIAVVKELIDSYLSRRLSWRGFITGMTRWGFTAAAATSLLDSLAPLVRADTQGPATGTLVEGTGGELLAEQLRAAGVRFIFNCNTSATYALFDALVDRPAIQVIQAPHEAQMISMAEGYALASGSVAVAVVGSVGFHGTLGNLFNAWKDRAPIVIISQQESVNLRRGHEFDTWDGYVGTSAAFTRWRWSVSDAEQGPEIARRAFRMASTPPTGPVALAFSSAALSPRRTRAAVIGHDDFMGSPRIKPALSTVEAAAQLLVGARSPLLIVGPEVTRSGGHSDVIKLAELLAIPVTQGERLFDDFPTNHPLFLGNYGWPLRFPRRVDVVLKLGSAMATSGTATVVHVGMDPAVTASGAPTDVVIAADVKETAADMLRAVEAVSTTARLAGIRRARLPAIEAYTTARRARRAQGVQAGWAERPTSWERMGAELDRLLDRDAIIVPEVSNDNRRGLDENTALTQLEFGPGQRRKIGPATGTALGWGVGAAIGVKLAEPDRQVVALQGDGGFMFGQAESLWTMARYEIPVIIVVFNNRSYNAPRDTIFRRGGRQAQSGKDMTCYLGDPDVDFAKIAAGFGVTGETVRTPDEIGPALQRAIEATRDGRPYLIDAIVERTGAGAASTWHPKYSLAAVRGRQV
jgi:thiamine pyrophosphate-dependent acetolactate synthase large subunit-like protein